MREMQMSFSDLMAEEREKTDLPEIREGDRAYKIPEDVWETRCRYCVHKHAEKNAAIPVWAVYKQQFGELIPCRIMTVANMHERPGECMSFAPRMDTYGICETCIHNNCFHEGFCMKEDHAEQRRVFYGQSYSGDERRRDYYGRHRLSVCDDYKPDKYARRDENE